MRTHGLSLSIIPVVAATGLLFHPWRTGTVVRPGPVPAHFGSTAADGLTRVTVDRLSLPSASSVTIRPGLAVALTALQAPDPVQTSGTDPLRAAPATPTTTPAPAPPRPATPTTTPAPLGPTTPTTTPAPLGPATPTTTAPPKPEGPSAPSTIIWAELRQCESDGDYTADTGNGYFGAYQFSLATWQWLGQAGLPDAAPAATQDAAAARLQELRGWGQWPVCSRRLGLL